MATSVGININTIPAHKLDIEGTVADPQLLRLKNTGDYARMILDGTTNTGGDIIYKVAGVSKYGIAFVNATGLQFFLNDTTAHFHFNNAGVFRMYQYTAGTLTTDATGIVSATSDIRVKENIVYYEEPNNIEKIKRLRPATFNFIGNKNTDKVLGFIAQDLEKVIPEAVDGKKFEYWWKKDKEGEPVLDENGNLIFDKDQPRYRGVSDRAIISIMVKAIQEQQTQIEQLQNQNQSLEQRLSLLEQRLSR